jgi:hypothetical protein
MSNVRRRKARRPVHLPRGHLLNKNSHLIALSESTAVAFGRIPFLLQSNEQKVFSAIWALESQVNDGGFLQYFLSQDGETAAYAPNALNTIGAARCAALAERALNLAANTPLPADYDQRRLLLDSLTEADEDALNGVDAEFYEYPDNLTELLFAYVCARPAIFGVAPNADA